MQSAATTGDDRTAAGALRWAMKRDFSELYSELGLPAGCTLEELKLAYRRRIAKLHPDHGHAPPDAGMPLPDLAGLYASATRFHRHHGRLPGATATPGPGGDAVPRRRATSPPGVPPPVPATPAAAVRLPLAALLLPLVAVLLLLLLSRDWSSPAGSDTPEQGAPLPARLEAGMDETTVLAVQGPPSFVRDGRWHYGPSWLQFEHGRLVDWRSAPEYPLKTADAVPATSPASNEPTR